MACLMPVRFLSEAELARLSSCPDEIADDDLVTYPRSTGRWPGRRAVNVQMPFVR